METQIHPADRYWTNLTFYPEEGEKGLYYIEFTEWPEEGEWWRLFRRNYIWSEEEFEKVKQRQSQDTNCPFPVSREGHPYQLANGKVNPMTNAIDLETKSFLKYLVDALNEKHKREQK